MTAGGAGRTEQNTVLCVQRMRLKGKGHPYVTARIPIPDSSGGYRTSVIFHQHFRRGRALIYVPFLRRDVSRSKTIGIPDPRREHGWIYGATCLIPDGGIFHLVISFKLWFY